MNKAEITIVALLFALLLAWFYHEQVNAPQRARRAEQAQAASPANAPDQPVELPDATPATNVPALRNAPAGEFVAGGDAGHTGEEQTAVIENADVVVTLSAWGGVVKTVEMRHYRAALEHDSGPLVMDFSRLPALAMEGIPGLSTNNDFVMESLPAERMVRFRRAMAGGWSFERTVRLAETGYRLKVSDQVFGEPGTNGALLPAHSVTMGPMHLEKSRTASAGISYLGVDMLPEEGGKGIQYLSSKIPGFFGAGGSWLSCGRQSMVGVPDRISHVVSNPVAWVAVKNKFFVQILTPPLAAPECRVEVVRDTNSSSQLLVDSVSARLRFVDQAILPGVPVTREWDYYVGPKLWDVVRHLPNYQEDVMEFGALKWFCKLLLRFLNAIYVVVPNYGAAILLLTLLVRGVFWPITRKGTQSMKKLQTLQPQINEIRAKYKDKPQKMNEEVMALYRANKVNPMSGCLPLLVQLPILFALFTVLRSAVELRFASFLWIRDLSEPEGLLANIVPFGVNILPILMTLTSIWQQHLTPMTGDPQQKKMMTYMMLIMLFMFYSMASALVLYWTFSQLLSIAGLLYQRWQQQRGTAAPAQPKPTPA